MTLKPGSEAQIMKVMEGTEAGRDGHIATYVMKSDSDANIHFVTTIYESKSAYKAFADSPEQSQRFLQLRELLAAEPDWHDGEVVHQSVKVASGTR